jgi:hypothetical protein
MLLAQKSYVEGALALVLYAGKLLDDERTATTAEERERAHLLLDTLTPIVKSWPSQALAAAGGQGPFYDGKRAAARFFYRYELPRTAPQLDLLASLDRTTLDTDPAWL